MEIRACLRDFAGVVTVNEKMAGRYKKHGIRTVAACNYADISEIPWPPRVFRSLRPRFVSTGGQFADRGALEILDAFNLLDPQLDCELAFWGTFYPPEFADEIRARAYRTPATADRVQVGGPYPWKVLAGELIPTAWAGCVLFNPTEKNDLESIPNRFFECWANGVPVIATSGSETARLIKEEGGGFVVDRNDTRAIAEAFRELAENPDLAVKMGSAGRRAVEREYCWEKAFQNILLLYAALGVNPQVLAKTRPGRTALAP
jgi:glycosyltransferase involved in cell wall biosynthesis